MRVLQLVGIYFYATNSERGVPGLRGCDFMDEVKINVG